MNRSNSEPVVVVAQQSPTQTGALR